jgi:hypothetical protein
MTNYEKSLQKTADATTTTKGHLALKSSGFDYLKKINFLIFIKNKYLSSSN